MDRSSYSLLLLTEILQFLTKINHSLKALFVQKAELCSVNVKFSLEKAATKTIIIKIIASECVVCQSLVLGEISVPAGAF